MSAKNKAIVEQITQAYNQHRLDQVAELLGPDFVGHNPMMPEPMRGPEALIDFFAAFLDAVPDAKIVENTLIAEGDLVVIHMREQGTFKNAYMGIPPNGETIEFWAANIWRIVDGKAVEWWLNMDTLGVMQQIGAIPVMA